MNSTEDKKDSSTIKAYTFGECDPSTKSDNRGEGEQNTDDIDSEAESGTAGMNSLWGIFDPRRPLWF